MNGYRLLQARELKRWTQADLADRIRASQGAVARIEQSSLRPSKDLAKEIADKTGFPIGFFYGTDPVQLPEGSLLLYRKRQKIKSPDTAYVYQIAQAAVTMYFHLRRSYRQPQSALPSLSAEGYREAARAARAALGYRPDVPIDRLIHTLEGNGIVCVAVPCPEVSEFEAFSAHIKGLPVMILNADRPTDRTRLTASHELDHLIRQRPIQVAELKTLELEAFRFAAEFLMPERAIRQELVPPVTISRLAELKIRWGVSIAALIHQAHALKIITKDQYRYLNIKISRLGWKVNEPGSPRLAPEKPRALRKMFEQVYSGDAKRLADELSFPVWLVQSIVAVHAEKASLPRKQPATVAQFDPNRALRHGPTRDSRKANNS